MDRGKFIEEAVQMGEETIASFRSMIVSDPRYTALSIEERMAIALLHSAVMLDADGSKDPLKDISDMAMALRAELRARAVKESEGE